MATELRNNNMKPTSKAEEYLQDESFDNPTLGQIVTLEDARKYAALVVAETLEKASDTDVSTETIMKQYPQRDAETEKFVSQNVHKRGGARWMRSILLPQLAKYKAELAEAKEENERLKEALKNLTETAEGHNEHSYDTINVDLVADCRALLTTPNAE